MAGACRLGAPSSSDSNDLVEMTAVGLDELCSGLRSVLRRRVDPRLDYVLPPKQLGAGAFSANYAFELAGVPVEWSGRLVLRLVPGSSLRVRTEAGLQDGARATGIPAPRVLFVEPSPEVLGEPFMVMEFLPGRGFLGGIEWYRFARDFPKMLRSWPATFANVMEVLATAESAPLFESLARRGVPEHLAVTTRHLSWIDQILSDDRASHEGITWLRANQPKLPQRLCLVHGDLWAANVLMDDGALCGLFDWTMGAVGDPALDVGFAKVGLALMPEPFPPPPPLRNVVHACGTRMARQVHERCAPLVGGDSRVGYYEALRYMVQIAGVYADRRAGRGNGWEHGVPALVSHFNTITGIDMATPKQAH